MNFLRKWLVCSLSFLRAQSAYILISLILIATGCVSGLGGNYVIVGEESYSVTLNPDGTFICQAAADVGGVYFRAEGSWRKVAPDVIETRISRILVDYQRRPALFPVVGNTDWVVAGN